MLGPLGTACRDVEHQSEVIPPMILEPTPPIDRHALPQALATEEGRPFPRQLGRATVVGNTIRTGARVKSEPDQEVAMGERLVEANACARSAVSL